MFSMLAVPLEHPIATAIIFMAGVMTSETVRRFMNKVSGGRLFGKKQSKTEVETATA